MRITSLLPILLLAACAGDPNRVDVQLSPAVISSLDGTTVVSAILAEDTTPLADVDVQVTIEYVDRNGVAHAVAPVDGRTDARGVFETTISGLTWDGIGTVTVSHGAVTGTATFSVLDRTPPKIEILPPTTDRRVGPGLPLDVQIHVSDEIGVSTVILDATGDINGGRTTLVASGAQDTTLTFRLFVDPDAAPGPTIQLFALASDLSSNLVAAAPLELIVDPAITISTPPGLTGSVLVDGNASQLVDPRAIVASTKDGMLYVADSSTAGNCPCVWRVDPATGTISGTAVVDSNTIPGNFEGIAVDATSDHLYLTSNQDRIYQLTWNTGAARYDTPTECVDANAQQPTGPFHLVIDSVFGILVTDDGDRNVQSVALACSATTVGQELSAVDSFDQPRGIATNPAGDIFVSDVGTDEVSRVDRSTGAVTLFDSTLDRPYGIEWLAGGPSPYADSLMVAANGDRIVASTKGGTSIATAYLGLRPIDLAFIGGTLYVAAERSGVLNHGRIYKVTGF